MADRPTPEEEDAEESSLFWIGMAFVVFVLVFCGVLVWIIWKQTVG